MFFSTTFRFDDIGEVSIRTVDPSKPEQVLKERNRRHQHTETYEGEVPTDVGETDTEGDQCVPGRASVFEVCLLRRLEV